MKTVMELTESLFDYTKKKVPFMQCQTHARAYVQNKLGPGIFKDYFDQLNGIEPTASVECRVPTCTNQTTAVYCTDCLALKGVVPGLILDMLCGR